MGLRDAKGQSQPLFLIQRKTPTASILRPQNRLKRPRKISDSKATYLFSCGIISLKQVNSPDRRESEMGYTKKQAGIIYSNIKRGNLTVPKGWTKAMYAMVGNNWNAYALRHESDFNQRVFWQTQRVLDFIFDGRYDLCQYVIDGYSVETEQLDRVISSTTVTQDMLDNPENYGINDMFFDFMYEVGDTYEVSEPYFEYVIKDEHNNEVARMAC